MEPTPHDEPPHESFVPPFDRGSFGEAMDAGYEPSTAERDQAFYAHLIAGLVPLVGLPGFLAPLLIAALRNEKAPFFLFHANQSFWFQVVCFGSALAIAVISVPLVFVCIGYFTMLLALVPWILSIVFPLVLAFSARNGEWSLYPFVGESVLRTWRPLLR